MKPAGALVTIVRQLVRIEPMTDIDSNIPPPKTRKKRVAAAPIAERSNLLVQAIEFVSMVNKDIGTPLETHIRLVNRTAVSFNGTLAAGAMITEDLTACPHAGRFLDALRQCKGAELSITQGDGNALRVASGRFRALIPYLDAADLQTIAPDAPTALVDERLRTALVSAGAVATDGGATVLTASVLLRSGSCVGTDRAVMIEYWHGIDLPANLIVPKVFISLLAKLKKKLVSFGYSQSSITIYFDDNTWLRTQLYAEQWPNVDRLLNVESDPKPMPPLFFEALDAVAPFSTTGHVNFIDGKVCSHTSLLEGATYDCPDIPNNFTFSIQKLKAIQPFCKLIDFQERITLFFADNVRGLIVWVSKEN